MANTVLKKYSCNHNELITDRISSVVNDIEMFLSKTQISSVASTYDCSCYYVL